MKKFFRASVVTALVALAFLSTPAPTRALQECGLNDPLGIDCAGASGLTSNDPRLIVARIINVALGLLGTIAVALIVYAGFLWMTAAGNEDQITKARGIIFAAIIGLLIILSAYAISNYVIKNIYAATNAAQYP